MNAATGDLAEHDRALAPRHIPRLRAHRAAKVITTVNAAAQYDCGGARARAIARLRIRKHHDPIGRENSPKVI
jgi:hypothetical protein